jgi:hypothetical protein
VAKRRNPGNQGAYRRPTRKLSKADIKSVSKRVEADSISSHSWLKKHSSNVKELVIHAFVVVLVEATFHKYIPDMIPWGWMLLATLGTWDLLRMPWVVAKLAGIARTRRTIMWGYVLCACFGAVVFVGYWKLIQAVLPESVTEGKPLTKRDLEEALKNAFPSPQGRKPDRPYLCLKTAGFVEGGRDIRLVFRNHSDLPAKDTEIQYRFTGSNDPGFSIDNLDPNSLPTSNMSSGTVSPRSDFGATILGPTPEQFSALSSGLTKGYLWGRIRYKSLSGEWFEPRDCLIWARDLKRFVPCPKNKYTDGQKL